MIVMRGRVPNILVTTFQYVIAFIVFTVLGFVGLGALTSIAIAWIVGWDTPPYPGQYVEMALGYTGVFLSLLYLFLKVRQRISKKDLALPAALPLRFRDTWLYVHLRIDVILILVFTILGFLTPYLHLGYLHNWWTGPLLLFWILAVFYLLLLLSGKRIALTPKTIKNTVTPKRTLYL